MLCEWGSLSSVINLSNSVLPVLFITDSFEVFCCYGYHGYAVFFKESAATVERQVYHFFEWLKVFCEKYDFAGDLALVVEGELGVMFAVLVDEVAEHGGVNKFAIHDGDGGVEVDCDELMGFEPPDMHFIIQLLDGEFGEKNRAFLLLWRVVTLYFVIF